ncbi:MAG: Na+:solute symporter [Lacunisphaera sp.]|nr:Na+:solute symporter [Lacunisphaera sp.]
MQPLHWIDYTIIGTYLAVSLGIGLKMSKRAGRDSESYFLGSRSMPWWVNGISLAATSFASDTPLVVTEMVRGRGLQRLWWLFAGVLALTVAVYLFSRLWRRLEAMTDAEFCELRYDGRPAAVLRGVRAFMSGVVGNLITMAWVTLGMASIITVMMPVDKWTAVGLAMGVTLIYTMFGGFFSAVLTDVFQFAIAVGAMLLLAVMAVWQFGGMAAVLDAVRASPAHGERTLALFPDFAHANLDLACFLILLGLWWTDSGAYVTQRMSACRNERDAAKAMMFFALWQAIRPWMWAVVALVSIALFPVLTPPLNDTSAYPMVMNHYLGIGLRGLLITAFLGAFMSTITTQLNWGASYLMRDGYCRFLRPQAPERERVLVSRVMTVLLAIAGIGLTPLLSSVTEAWEFLALLMAGGGIIGVFRWFWWRMNAWTELAAMGSGLGCALFNIGLQIMAPRLPVFGLAWADWRFELKLLLFTVVALVASAVATYATRPVGMEKLRAFNRKVRPGGWWAPVENGEDLSQLPPPVLTRRTALDVLGGLALCLGTTVGIGLAVLLRPGPSALAFAVALLGAVAVYRWFQRDKLFTTAGKP